MCVLQFATGAIKAILSTPADEQKCIREQISRAIAGEAESCLRKKVQAYNGVPDIPDLEEGAFAIREQVRRTGSKPNQIKSKTNKTFIEHTNGGNFDLVRKLHR